MQLHDSQRTMRSMTGESQEGSQDIDTFAMQSAMDQHKKSVQVRRRERETRIRKAHNQHFDALRQRAEECGEAHPQQVKASKLPQIQRLLELLRRKRQLEDTIHVSMGDLEKSFKLAADQLSLCIRART